MRMNNRYNEIINLPHHVSKTRPQMPMSDRAAQFAPFAALTGYDSAIRETGRLTDEKIELDEEALTALDMKFQLPADGLGDDGPLMLHHIGLHRLAVVGRLLDGAHVPAAPLFPCFLNFLDNA